MTLPGDRRGKGWGVKKGGFGLGRGEREVHKRRGVIQVWKVISHRKRFRGDTEVKAAGRR